MLEKATAENISTAFSRAEVMKPCPIGADGSCCKNCAMGPCRIPLPRGKDETPEEHAKRVGICGASAETVAARNFARMIAAGTASHSDHGRRVVESFKLMAEGKTKDFEIKDEEKLMKLALDLGIEIGSRTNNEIAIDIANKMENEFGKQSGELLYIKKAPIKRQEIWRNLGVVPRGIDREVVELMHRTHIGTDQDYKNIMLQATRTALADGWGGSMITTEIQDCMYGTPTPTLSEINLGVLKEDMVNVIIHGHEPSLAEMLAQEVSNPEMIEYAKSKGAKGINLAGMCCTSNEVMMRHGVPIAGNFLQQELAIITGAVEAMVVDVQCIMQGLQEVARCFHTKLITTDDRAKITGATYMAYDEHNPRISARSILKAAIDNYPNRIASKVRIPKDKMPLIAGFSHETINYLLGGLFRASYRPLNDNIINGRIRGLAGVVGCNNVRTTHDSAHIAMIKELLKNDVLVLSTGCGAMAAAKAGLMVPEAAKEFCGPGLAEVCETVGIPPVLHMGACVDNSRILIAATAVVKDGGLGDDISDLPVAGAAPEWMSEKAIAIGQYFVASGVYTVFGTTFPTLGSKEFTNYLFKGMEELYGGRWDFQPDPIKAAHLMIAHIDKKRKALGIDKARDRVLFDMAMRRDLEG
jgi:carbon-monoxide dehydrogenase catalytic subunit